MQSSPPFTAVGWKPRILVGILAGILAVVLGRQGFFEVVERPFYDQRVRLLAPLNPISEEIVLLTLDDESLERMRDSLGSWRWPRIVFGGVIDYCEEARSICFGLPPAPEGEQYGETHAILEEEIRAFGSLACGCRLDASELEAPILPGLSRFFLDIEDGPAASPRFSRIDLPCLEMLSGSATMGFIDHHPDSDGLVRAVLPCVRVYDYWLPSLSMAGHFSGLNGASSRVGWIDQGRGFVVGENAFYCRSDGSVLLRPSNQHYRRIPLADIFESIRAEIEGRIPSVSRGFFVGKHVLIGSTASGALGRDYQTPLPRLKDEIEISAVALDNLMSGTHYYLAPAWAGALLILVSSLFCGLFFRNRRLPALIVWPGFLVLLLGIPTLIQHFAGAVLPVGAATTGSVLSAVVVGTLIWGREQRLLRMLTEAEATKQKLTDMLVHDLKNRLSPIMISLSLVRERTSVFEDHELDELLRVAERSSTGLLEQVHNLLDIRKMQEGHLRLNRKVFEIVTVLEEELRQYGPAARTAGLDIVCNNRNGTPSVYADPNVVSRVVSNLISNALDYATPGTPIELSWTEEEDGWVSVTVANQGKPIPAEEHDAIFQCFLGGNSKGLRSVTARGWGLGLAFCKLAIEEHGGRIWITSPLQDQESGVALTFTLPLPAGPSGPVPPNSDHSA